jgi:hypothetical protein
VIGYMVGWAVHKGAGGGGRRFQVLAIALTYGAVALAYTPIVVKAAIEARRKEAPAAATTTPAADTTEARPSRPPVIAVLFLLGLIVALPVVVVVSGLPSSLISAAIIFFGMRQAWKMTGKPPLVISGPYRVGASPAVPA